MNWKTNWKTWGLGLYATAALSSAQAGLVSETQANKLDFQLIPMVLDEKDIPQKDKEKYRQIELQREKPAEASKIGEMHRFQVSNKVYLTHSDVEDVRVVTDALGQFALHIRFKSDSKQKLENLTQAFLGRQVVVMNQEQGVYYGSAFVSHVLSDGLLEWGGLASLKEAEHIANGIRKHVEFRGVDDGVQADAAFENLNLKSASYEDEHSFKIWADKEKIIQSEDVDKLLIRKMEKGEGEEAVEFNKTLEMYGDVHYAALKLKDKGWDKLEGFQSAALVGKDNKFIKFIPDYGAENLQLEVFLDEEQKEQFLRKITK